MSIRLISGIVHPLTTITYKLKTKTIKFEIFNQIEISNTNRTTLESFRDFFEISHLVITIQYEFLT